MVGSTCKLRPHLTSEIPPCYFTPKTYTDENIYHILSEASRLFYFVADRESIENALQTHLCL